MRWSAPSGPEAIRAGTHGGDAVAALHVARGEARLVAGGLTMRLDLRCGARVTAVESSARPGQNLIDRWCGYEADGECWSDAPQPGERAFAVAPARTLRSGRVDRGAGLPHRMGREEVIAQAAAPHLHVEKRFTVDPSLPFVRVRYRVQTTGVEGRGPGLSLGLPAISFSDRLVDPFELAEDTADDGVDLGDGLTLPAWRAFSDQRGDYGLLIFSAERPAMSRVQLTERGFAFRPSYYLAYSTEVVTTRELRLGQQYHNYGPVDELDWFLGAYRREHLPALRRIIAGFHARRRLAGRGEILEVSSALPDAALPPLDALPEPLPIRLALSPGSSVQRYYVLPVESRRSKSTTSPSPPAPAGRQIAVHSPTPDVVVSVRPLESRSERVSVEVTCSPAAAPGVRRFAAPLPVGQLALTLDVAPPEPLPVGDGQVLLGADTLTGAAEAAGWLAVHNPVIAGGCALVVRPGGRAAPLRIEPAVRGSYDVYAGIARGFGLKVRLDGDPYWTYVTADATVDVQNWQPLESVCRGLKEVRLRRIALDGGGLWVAPHPNTQGYTVLTHLRLVPAPPPDPPPLLTGRRPFVAGLADTPDVSYELAELAADSFHEAAWRETFWQHATHGIDTVYWRVDGQCADFHTKIGTVRYSIPRTHSLDSPISRYYGLALQRLDPLRIAVEEGKRRGLRIFGWMRANNYSGNAVARFFLEHPEWHEAREDGTPAPQLCFAIPEVRAHKAAILREAVGYGLDGLLIDTLRHPPMVGYAPAVVEAFHRRYGEAPPRAPGSAVGGRFSGSSRQSDDRTGEPWQRWYRFRAEFFTRFLRDLRAGLAADGHPALPIHLRIAPRHYLQHGADLEALLAEQLVDVVVASRYLDDPLDYESLFPVVRDRVPLCAICDPLRKDPIDLLLRLQADQRLGGIGVYESEWSVHTPGHREVLLEVARQAAAANAVRQV